MEPGIRVESSVLTHIAYDAQRRRVLVRFHHGGEYAYSPVPPWVWQRFVVAPSKGAFYNGRIRGRYRCIRLTPPTGSGGAPEGGDG